MNLVVLFHELWIVSCFYKRKALITNRTISKLYGPRLRSRGQKFVSFTSYKTFVELNGWVSESIIVLSKSLSYMLRIAMHFFCWSLLANPSVLSYYIWFISEGKKRKAASFFFLDPKTLWRKNDMDSVTRIIGHTPPPRLPSHQVPVPSSSYFADTTSFIFLTTSAQFCRWRE